MISQRLSQRGLRVQEDFVFESGLIRPVAAVINEQDASKSLWDRMSLDDNQWAVKNRTRLEGILNDHTELFDFENYHIVSYYSI